jgi:dihydrodipicolinate synthase/N-acetylneuraminate lyase
MEISGLLRGVITAMITPLVDQNHLGYRGLDRLMVYSHSVCELLKDRPDFTMLVGPEELMAEAVLAGGHGGMCEGSNFLPKLNVNPYEAAAGGNLQRVTKVHQKVR